jgi:hypothetical protein
MIASAPVQEQQERIMSFGLGLVLFILGSVAIGVCIWAIPGRAGAAAPPSTDHGHGGH